MIKEEEIELKRGYGSFYPVYSTAGAAGFDVATTEDFSLDPMDRKLISTGLSFAIPRNCEIQIRPRSGLAFKHGVTVLNAPATIDSDYRGEIKVLLINLGKDKVSFKAGDRIAQMVLANVKQAVFEEVPALSETVRGRGGFGSTGI